MPVTVRTHLMTRRHNFADKRRIPLGDPPHDEKRGPDTGLVEHFKQPARRRDHTTGQLRPMPWMQRVVGAADVKPFLDVDGEDVHGRRGPAFAWMNSAI